MYAQPGKKLIFMGGEFAQWREWHHDESLDWHLLQYAPHQGMHHWVRDLNQFYRNERSMYSSSSRTTVSSGWTATTPTTASSA